MNFSTYMEKAINMQIFVCHPWIKAVLRCQLQLTGHTSIWRGVFDGKWVVENWRMENQGNDNSQQSSLLNEQQQNVKRMYRKVAESRVLGCRDHVAILSHWHVWELPSEGAKLYHETHDALPWSQNTMQIANTYNEHLKQELCTTQTIHKLGYLSKSFASKFN